MSRPAGQPTRGKTALNRLRRIDVYVALAMPGLLRGDAPLAVDLGFGAAPWTTLEMARRWARIEPTLRTIGLEIDPERVAAALPFDDPPAVSFARGGFNLADSVGAGAARVVRCYNVLRQYEEDAVPAALAAMAAGVEPGGAIIEGTSTPSGGMAAFDVWRRPGAGEPVGPGPGGLAHDRIVLATNFRADHGPDEFRTILPKRLIHRTLEGDVARLLGDWGRARDRARGAGLTDPRRMWAAAAAALRDAGWPVDVRARVLARGFLVIGDRLRDLGDGR